MCCVAQAVNIGSSAGRQMSASGGFMMMMQHTCSRAAPSASRFRPRSGGGVTIGTLILAAASATLLVSMSGCHSTPVGNAFAATPTDRAVEARLRLPDTMPPLQPFDEHFVTVEDTDAP
jgi:hypothetical protein